MIHSPEPTVHRMPHGAELEPDGRVRFRLWAPDCGRIELALEPAAGCGALQRLPMLALADGWHELVTATAAAGSRYRFVLPDGLHVPDPASRFQPDDVHGPSEVIDAAAYAWGDAGWSGRPWSEVVVYELHVGAFTPEGTFRGVIGHLDHLAALGVSMIELMPVADFPGTRNWGYDGVLPYAPDSAYGRPDDFKALVDAAHAHGIMVMLDVVYNHFGPDGNYLPLYARTFFTDRHKTPWGPAINYDGAHARPVREFIIHNALYWLEEYHLDGLRLDAVHAILDDGSPHILDELAARARALLPRAHLVLENEENQARRLVRGGDDAPLTYTAQWNDDLHHGLHVAATGEHAGYYADYRGDTGKLARALAEGFAFQGEWMAFRGAPRGEPSGLLPPSAFVGFIQNHDQIGNRAFGDRLTNGTPPAALRAIAAVYLLSPQVPMLFMGEEWGSTQPFPFFCDFSGELADAVRRGRREEFARFPEFQDEKLRERIPDPQSADTYSSAKLEWGDLAQPRHAEWLQWYARLLAIRRTAMAPLFAGMQRGGTHEVRGDGVAAVCWPILTGEELLLEFNLSPRPAYSLPAATGRVLWEQGDWGQADGAGPWYVRWSVRASRRA